jgi:leucyl aminopeptidase
VAYAELRAADYTEDHQVKIVLSERPIAETATDLLVVGAFKNGVLGEAAREVDEMLGGYLAEAAKEEMKASVGESVLVHTLGRIRAKRVLVVGLGKEQANAHDAVRDAIAAAMRVAQRVKATRVATTLLFDVMSARGSAQEAPTLPARALAEGAGLGPYSFEKYKTNGTPPTEIESLTIAVPRGSTRSLESEIERGRILAEASCFARDLVAEPAVEMTPTRMAEIASGFSGLSVKVFDTAAIEKMGMGALRGVSLGSTQPPKFIRLLYRPEGTRPSGSRADGAESARAAGARARGALMPSIDFAFVGKGITFDSGGINLKPSDGIAKMKYDMSGGAAVLAAMRALSQLRPNVSILGLVPCTENMPGGSAIKPGDVLRTLSGKTVEVENTDAEGRLILADALTYGVREGARALVDIATLTGACVIALGRGAAGLMGNDETLKQQVRAAAERAGERVWELPLYEDYLPLTQSEIADLKNTGGRDGGTITAGLFLQEFVEGHPWVHLDIASTAWTDKDIPVAVKGPTGFGARLLLNLALSASAGDDPGANGRPRAAARRSVGRARR